MLGSECNLASQFANFVNGKLQEQVLALGPFSPFSTKYKHHCHKNSTLDLVTNGEVAAIILAIKSNNMNILGYVGLGEKLIGCGNIGDDFFAGVGFIIPVGMMFCM